MPITTNNSAIPDYLLAGDSDALSLLLQQSFPRKQQSQRPPLEKEELLELLKTHTQGSLIDAIKTGMDDTKTLSDKDFATLHFVDQLFQLYHSSSHHSEEISDLMDKLRPLVATALVNQDGFILDRKHSIQQCISIIQQNTLGWQPEDSRAASRYLDDLGKLVDAITEANNASLLLEAKKQLQQFFNRDKKRINKIEQRLSDNEKGLMQSRYAKETSTLELNKRLRGQKLPIKVTQFLQTSWLDSLQLSLINHSAEGEEWKYMLSLTERLIASFQQSSDDETLTAEIPKISEDLKKYTYSLIHDEQNLETQLSLVAAEHFKILQGDLPDCELCEPVDGDNPLISAQAKISRSLLQEVDNIEEGQWFLLHKVNQKPQRIRLAMKYREAGQLLFINQLGLKVEQFSFEEFAYKLSSRVAIAIQAPVDFHEFTSKFIGKLYVLQEEKQQQKRDAKEEAKKEAHRKEEERIEARAKAIAEATALAESEAEKRLQQIKSDADKLAVGSWIEFSENEGENRQLRLAAKIQSTGDYIFVNRMGLKQGQFNYQEILKRLNDGTAKVIQQGDSNEDPLAKVVDNLRK